MTRTANSLTRRNVLRKTGATTVGGGLVAVTATPASAACSCDTGDCSDFCGEKIEVIEHNGHAARYEVYSSNACLYDCYLDSYESNDYHYYDGGTGCAGGGTVKGGTDKWLLSGGGITYVRVCDRGDPGAMVEVRRTYCGDHCAAGWDGFAPVAVEQLSDSASGPASGTDWCTDPYQYVKARYQFQTSVDVEPYSDLESNDEEEFEAQAEGYLYGADVDNWDTYGRVNWVIIEPEGSDVIFKRRADDDCV